MTSERTEAADMTDDLQAENARWLRNYIDGQADTMDTMRAEVDACHANINTKADFIDATIHQLAYADEVVDTLRAEVARLREALEWYGVQVHTFATDQTGKADEADVVLDLDRGSRARAALEYGETDQ